MPRLELDIDKIIGKLKKLSGNLSDMTDFYREVSQLELSNTLLRFREEKAPDGTKWRDPITLRRSGGGSASSKEQAWGYWKASNFHAILPGWRFFSRAQGDKVLRDTGVLNQSIQRVSGKDYAEVGTNVQYGKHVQNLGFPFLGISKQTEKNVVKVFMDYMRNKTE